MSSQKVSGNLPKNSIGEMMNLLKIHRRTNLLIKGFALFFCLLVVSLNSFGQATGDYRTLAAGNWNANTTWQRYNGTAWANCIAGDYPGASAGAGIVTILSGNNVTLNVDVTIAGLIINANLTAITNRTLNITGSFNLVNGTVNLSNQNN